MSRSPTPALRRLSSQVQVTAITLGAYALDTIALGSKFDLIGGGRWDRSIELQSVHCSGVGIHPGVGLPSWRGALVYKPKPNGSIYFDAGNSFNPSAESLSLSAANANTPPEKSLTFEVGTKWDMASGKLSVNGSMFRTDKTNAREPDPNNPLLNVLGGQSACGRVSGRVERLSDDRWEILSSYALLDGKVVSSQFYPLSVGADSPTFRGTLSISGPPTGFRGEIWKSAGAEISWTSARPVPRFPTIQPRDLLKQVPGYWVFNAMANYPLSERISLQLNLNNLTNKYYYDQIHPAHIVPGAGFTALVGINFKF